MSMFYIVKPDNSIFNNISLCEPRIGDKIAFCLGRHLENDCPNKSCSNYSEFIIVEIGEETIWIE